MLFQTLTTRPFDPDKVSPYCQYVLMLNGKFSNLKILECNVSLLIKNKHARQVVVPIQESKPKEKFPALCPPSSPSSLLTVA